ncbi:40S ribosomal protein S5-1 [Hordeum vulgare]|nr:40S ribosomal protein S5-1 [Hordeum vulgare]
MKVINPYLPEGIKHPQSIEMHKGVLHIRDVQGPNKEGSEKARLEVVEHEIFKCQGMVEHGLSSNHSMTMYFIWENNMDTMNVGEILTKLKIGSINSKIKSMNSKAKTMSMSLGEIKKNESLLTDEEPSSPKESSSPPFVHMCLVGRGNDEVSSSLSDNDDICNEDDDDDLTENIYVIDLRSSKGEIEIAHGKLKEDFDLLILECNNVKGELIKTSKIYEELQSTHGKSLIATYSSRIVDDTCASNSTSFEASTLKKNVELCAQLDLLTSNYGKLEESHENLLSTHEDLLISHNELKLELETMDIKVKSCESHVNISTSTINTLLPCANPCNSSISHIITNHDELLVLSCCSNHEFSTSTSPIVSSVETNHVEEINELKAQVTNLKKELKKSDDVHSYHCNKKSMNKRRGKTKPRTTPTFLALSAKRLGIT